MGSSSVAALIETVVTQITDVLIAALPGILLVAGGLFALFLLWRYGKRLIGGR